MTKNDGQRQAAFFLLLILFFSGLLAFFLLQEGHDWGGDFALYLRQAQSILDGTSEELLVFNRFAMEHSTQQAWSNPQIGPHLYPWGFPLLLTPIVAVFGFALTPLKLYVTCFFLLSLFICYRLFLPKIGNVNSLWLVSILGLNPFLLDFLNIISSDIPFLFFALLSILFIEKSLSLRQYFLSKTVTLLLTGILIYFAFLVRTNGIILVGVLGVGQIIKWYKPMRSHWSYFLKKEWTQLLPYGSFIGCWIVFKSILPSGSGSHLVFLKRITPGKLLYNFYYYFELPSAFYEGVNFSTIIYGITIPFLILGVAKSWRKLPDGLYLIYCLSSLFLFVLWPPIQGLRFIFSLLPFYLYFVFLGLRSAEASLSLRKIGERNISWIAVFSICLVSLFMFRNTVNIYEVNQNYPQRKIIEGPYTPESQEAFQFLKENSNSEDVIIFFKPRVLSFFVDRQSLRLWEMSEIEREKGDYLLYYKLVDFGQPTLEELVELKKQRTPIFENEHFVLFNLHDLASKDPN